MPLSISIPTLLLFLQTPDADAIFGGHSPKSETRDMIFVEGELYGKLVARNDQPLSAAEAAKEEKKLRETAAERRLHPEHRPITERAVHVAHLPDIFRFYSCSFASEESVNDRQAWIILCNPQ